MAYANDPAFSPDGGSIVFCGAMQRSKRDPGFSEELYILRMDASLPPRRLTHYPERDTTAAGWPYRAGPPSWRPDGGTIT